MADELLTFTYGQLTVTGTLEQCEAVKPIALKVPIILAERIAPVMAVWVPQERMPLFAPGKHALGFYRSRPHRILLSEAARSASLGKILAHELVHVLDDDYWRRPNRKALMPLLDPEPDNYSDIEIDGELYPYVAAPSECLAVWVSAALFGFPRPAFANTYLRRIAREDLPAAGRIALA
jgi:hypothetical protein